MAWLEGCGWLGGVGVGVFGLGFVTLTLLGRVSDEPRVRVGKRLLCSVVPFLCAWSKVSWEVEFELMLRAVSRGNGRKLSAIDKGRPGWGRLVSGVLLG